MTLTEANVRLAALLGRQRRHWIIRLEQVMGGACQWSVWDGFEHFYGPTLEQAVRNCEVTHQIGVSGSVVAAEMSLAS